MYDRFRIDFPQGHNNKRRDAFTAQMAATVKQWQAWIGGIAAQNKLSGPPKRLTLEGRVVKAGVVTNGPYSEIKECIGGVIFIKASDFDEAVSMAKGCPVLHLGGNVEVRELLRE